ncbi:hypothetical protein ID866_960 [Astraeus odoratus]|nr:hypothetical protein ID866_960 [Astraeus odoratus]
MGLLPSTFRALYRLVLRATSASVLHNIKARKNLFRLWRPIFDRAGQVTRDLETKTLAPTVRLYHEELLNTWQKRMDHTLTFLLSSAQSRGLSHRVVRNVNILSEAHRLWIRANYYRGAKRWNPHLPPSSPTYDPKSLLPADMRAVRKRDRRREAKVLDERCWDALGEVIRMAEARHNLSLGRHRMRPWKIE